MVTTSPFKLPENEEERKIVEQNSYTNKCLNIIGDQLDKIEIKLDTIDIKKTIPIPNKEKPLIKLHEIRQGLGLKSNKTKTSEKIEQILQELAKVKPKEGETSKTINVLEKNNKIKTSSFESETSYDEEINKLENPLGKFKE